MAEKGDFEIPDIFTDCRMAEALPIPLWATISNNPWLREKYGFIRSVVPEVDKSSLCAELTLCETEEDVEAILQSLLLQHDSTFMAEPVASQLQQASSIDKRQEDQMQQDRVVVERPSVDMDEVEISEFPETCDNISVDGESDANEVIDVDGEDDANYVINVDGEYDANDIINVVGDVDANDLGNIDGQDGEHDIINVDEDSDANDVISDDSLEVLEVNKSYDNEIADVNDRDCAETLGSGDSDDYSEIEDDFDQYYNDIEVVNEIDNGFEIIDSVENCDDIQVNNEVDNDIEVVDDISELLRPIAATAGIGSQLDIEEVVLDSDEGSREEEAMALEATELGETAANAQALADYQSQEDAQLAANIAFIENLFPDAAPAFLQEKYDKCLEIQGLPEELAKFVDGLLKITKYPTNKDRIKEERKANRSSDLTSEWLYDDIGDEQVVAGVMLHCPICLEEKLEIDCCNALKNDHIYCVQCIESYVKAEMEQGRSTFKCMEDGCCAEFTMKVLRRVLDHSVLSRVLEQRQHEEILAAEIEDLESCPFCFFKVIVSNPSNKIFQCQNPDCLVDSCRLCKEESHIPLRCEEVEKDPQKEARKKLENKMSDAVIRECPQCKKRFIKEDGCNHITCSCGASICYYCKHLTNSPEHMNSNRCQQIVDANVIHRQDVHTAAMEGKQEMDPSITLVHDPTADIL